MFGSYRLRRITLMQPQTVPRTIYKSTGYIILCAICKHLLYVARHVSSRVESKLTNDLIIYYKWSSTPAFVACRTPDAQC